MTAVIGCPIGTTIISLGPLASVSMVYAVWYLAEGISIFLFLYPVAEVLLYNKAVVAVLKVVEYIGSLEIIH